MVRQVAILGREHRPDATLPCNSVEGFYDTCRLGLNIQRLPFPRRRAPSPPASYELSGLRIQITTNSPKAQQAMHAVIERQPGTMPRFIAAGRCGSGCAVRMFRHCLSLEPLPPYALELNPTESLWSWIKRKRAHPAFKDAQGLGEWLKRTTSG